MMPNIVETSETEYEVIIANISWNQKSIRQIKKEQELPTQMTLVIPQNVLAQANKKGNDFNDLIESFTYNILTKKFGHEVIRCQIWLPL